MEQYSRRTTWYKQRENTIEITGKVNSFNVKDFCAAISLHRSNQSKHLTIDFSRVRNAYPNGMLPIISTVNLLRYEGHDIYIKLPQNDNTRTLFRAVN